MMFGLFNKKEKPVVLPWPNLTPEERQLVAKVLDCAVGRYGRLHCDPLRVGSANGVVMVTLYEQYDALPLGWPRESAYGVNLWEALENLLGRINLSAFLNHRNDMREKERLEAAERQPVNIKCRSAEEAEAMAEARRQMPVGYSIGIIREPVFVKGGG